jgi:hypothetical protein
MGKKAVTYSAIFGSLIFAQRGCDSFSNLVFNRTPRSCRQNRCVSALALYPFPSRSGKWIRARRKMQVPELQRHTLCGR